MKILIKGGEIGATYEEKIYNFWLHGELKSGKLIKIFVSHFPEDLIRFKNQHIECLVAALLINLLGLIPESSNNKKFQNIFKGIFLGRYKIPPKWKNYKVKESYALKTEDGIILLDSEPFESERIEIGNEIIIDVGRFDLKAWQPIDKYKEGARRD